MNVIKFIVLNFLKKEDKKLYIERLTHTYSELWKKYDTDKSNMHRKIGRIDRYILQEANKLAHFEEVLINFREGDWQELDAMFEKEMNKVSKKSSKKK